MDLIWDEDFDDADVEECILKASQLCPLPNIDTAITNKQSKAGNVVAAVSAEQCEKDEINNLLHDQIMHDDIFDPIDNIDPDLLSQPIPGTQPGQWFQKNSTFIDGHKTSENRVISAGPPIITVNRTIATKITSGFISGLKPQTQCTPGAVKSIAQRFPHCQDSNQFTIPLQPPMRTSHDNIVRGMRKPAAHQLNKSSTSLHNSTFINSYQSSSHVRIPSQYDEFNNISSITIDPVDTASLKRNEKVLCDQLQQSQKNFRKLEEEIVTKKGEVYCLLIAVYDTQIYFEYIKKYILYIKYSLP